MKSYLCLGFAAALAAVSLAPHSVLAQTPAPAQQTCLTPDDSMEAFYEVLGHRHPKTVTRECFPDGKLKLWKLSQDDTVRLSERDQSGAVVREISVYHDVYLAGWHMVVQVHNARGELIEQNWVNPDHEGNTLPATWKLLNVNVYLGKKDTDHPLAVILLGPNGKPSIARELRPDGNNDLQRYKPDGTLEYSIIVDPQGKKVGDHNGYKAGPLDPTWTQMPEIDDLPALKQ